MGTAFLIVVVSVVIIIINIFIGIKFAEVAYIKGYGKDNWAAASIFVGMPVWLLIVALPNKRYHEELLC
jgi:putative Mn2+ efflux pump MntP